MFKKLHGEIDMTDPIADRRWRPRAYGCELDFEATQAVIEQHGLNF